MKLNKSEPLEKGIMRYTPLELIVNHPKLQYRDIIDDHAAELSDSIEKNGLDVPLIIWDGGDPETQMKIKGEKHPASFLLAGLHRREGLRQFFKRDSKAFSARFPEGIPTVMFHGDENEAIAAQLRENVARENPSLAETLPFVERLKEAGLKSKKIARMIGKSASWVSQVLSIKEDLGDDATEAAKEGKLSLRDAKKLKDKKKKANKKGEDFDAKGEIEKIKSKKTKGGRTEKRLSVKAVYARYKALPSMKIGASKIVLESAFEYLVGDSDVLPEELQADDEQESKKDKKKGKKKKD